MKLSPAAVPLAPILAGAQDLKQLLGSLGAGLVGVWLARTIFNERENKRLRRQQTFRETAPITAMGMLLVGVWIVDHKPGLSAAAIAGLGVGWVAVLLLDIIGKRIIDVVRAALAVKPDDMDIPADMRGQLDQIDAADAAKP